MQVTEGPAPVKPMRDLDPAETVRALEALAVERQRFSRAIRAAYEAAGGYHKLRDAKRRARKRVPLYIRKGGVRK